MKDLRISVSHRLSPYNQESAETLGNETAIVRGYFYVGHN